MSEAGFGGIDELSELELNEFGQFIEFDVRLPYQFC
jgi:hypothetical protein